MLIGIIKWFDTEKGFGVIGTPSGDEFFLHISNVIDNSNTLSKGTAVIFDRLQHQLKAITCRTPSIMKIFLLYYHF